ncbi:MAG: hypothetical protein D6682_07360 [Zetaproteobacteria bacterium]|nr:MAG: hypothetical protein D6682_07360 [Zetaproteobacteria bacterium]
MVRCWRTTRWLLAPIALLHLAFTPGMLLWPQLPWSPSIEGAAAAARQSLRLIDWFLAASAAFHLLTPEEWRCCMQRLPLPAQWRLAVTALPPLLAASRIMIGRMRQRWRLERGRLRDLPIAAAACVALVLTLADRQAEAHWLAEPYGEEG